MLNIYRSNYKNLGILEKNIIEICIEHTYYHPCDKHVLHALINFFFKFLYHRIIIYLQMYVPNT